MTSSTSAVSPSKAERFWSIGVYLVIFLVGGGLILAASLYAGALYTARQTLKQAQQMISQTRLPLPDFRFSDSKGHLVTKQDLAGHIWVAACFFTRCGTVCPRITSTLRELQEKFRHVPDVRLVSVTVDPDHDRPEVLAAYAAAAGAQQDRWLFLTGSREEIYRFVREGLKLPAAPTPLEQQRRGADPVTHSNRLVLVDRQGYVRGYVVVDDPWQITLLLQAVELLRSSQ
jgi:protein SCO1/2